MAFWVDWELWEKLSVGLVLLYAFCVLGWNRWMTSKYAATEAKEREQEAEIYPMLHKDDVPFGARALESGIEVEGIWISDPNTPTQSPCQPATPAGSRPVSPAPRSLHRTVGTPRSSVGSQSSVISPKPIPPAARRGGVSEIDLSSAGYTYETHIPGGLYSRASLPTPNALNMSPAREEPLVGMKSTTGSEKRASVHSLPIISNEMRMSPAREESLIGMKDTTGSKKRASFPSQIFGIASNLDTKGYRVGLDGIDDGTDYVPAISDSSSGISSESKRSSLMKRLRRRSSEEFRRRMSQIFNDNIQMGVPAEELEFNPALRQYQRRFRKSLPRPFRPWINASGNE
ncbi:unnamed protein product [Penicillium glandicola]